MTSGSGQEVRALAGDVFLTVPTAVSEAQRARFGETAKLSGVYFQLYPLTADLAVLAIGERSCAALEAANRRTAHMVKLEVAR